MIELPQIAGQPRDATTICSVECGARCCRTPLSTPIVTGLEMRKLKAIAWSRGLKLKFLNAGGHSVAVTPNGVQLRQPTERHHMLRDRWVMLRAENGCQFLGQNTNLCTIYDERPAACQRFPMRPTRGCLLTPHADENDPTLIAEAA